MKISDLKPGDIIISRKYVSFWKHPIQWFFNWRVKCYSKKIYGPDCKLSGSTHARRASTQSLTRISHWTFPWFFHWTFPCAHFGEIETWMLDPEYALVFRRKEEIMPSADMWQNFFVQFAGNLYNLGKLFDMEFGFKRFFSFGKNHYVCSSGQRMAEESLLGIKNIFPEVSLDKTPPCSWANHPEQYECVNLEKDAPIPKVLKLELESDPCIFREGDCGCETVWRRT